MKATVGYKFIHMQESDPSGNIPCRGYYITLTLQCHLTPCSPESNEWKSYPIRLQANTAMLTELKLSNDPKVAWRGNVRATSTHAESWNKQLTKNKPQRRQVCSNASHSFAIKAKMKTILQMQSIRNLDFDLIPVISFNKDHNQLISQKRWYCKINLYQLTYFAGKPSETPKNVITVIT